MLPCYIFVYFSFQFAHVNNESAAPSYLKHGVPQGSMLEPILHIITFASFRYCIKVHCYVDDTKTVLIS